MNDKNSFKDPSLAAGKYFIGVIDAIRRVYVRNTYDIQQGNTLISIPFDAMAKGTYMLTIEDGNDKITALKFVKN